MKKYSDYVRYPIRMNVTTEEMPRDDEGKIIPEQHGERGVTPAPVLIRKGLDYEAIMRHLSDSFPSWDYRHGMYY